MSFMAMMRLSIWLLTFLIIIMLPTAVVPIFYIHFQHAKNRDSITAAAFWATIGYLIAVAFMVGFSLYLTAARVVLPRVGRFEGMRAVFSRAARHLGWSDPSTFGPVRRQLAFVGGGLAGAGLTAMLAYVVATASTNARNAPTWPYGLFGALMAVGAFFYLVGVVHFRRRTQGEGKDTV